MTKDRAVTDSIRRRTLGQGGGMTVRIPQQTATT